MIMRIHRLLGITLVFFILILSITGTLLQHAEDFNIRNNYASSLIAKNFYNIKPCKVYSFKYDNQWISMCNRDLYFNEKKIASDINSINSIYFNKGKYHVHYDNHEIIINSDSSIAAMGHTNSNENLNKNVLLKLDSISEKQRQIIENKSLSKTITYERIVVDLHSGRLFGSFGVTLVDLVTIGIILLSITGAYSWIRHKKIF